MGKGTCHLFDDAVLCSTVDTYIIKSEVANCKLV